MRTRALQVRGEGPDSPVYLPASGCRALAGHWVAGMSRATLALGKLTAGGRGLTCGVGSMSGKTSRGGDLGSGVREGGWERDSGDGESMCKGPVVWERELRSVGLG